MEKIKNIVVLPGVLLLAVACATAYRATPLPLGSFFFPGEAKAARQLRLQLPDNDRGKAQVLKMSLQ